MGRRGDAVLLDDERLEPDPVPVDLFAAARAAHRKSRHRMLAVDPAGAPVDLTGAVRAALAVTVHDLTEDVMPNNFAGNFGLRGMATWADAVADRRSRTGWWRTFDGPAAHASAMHRLYDCLTTEDSSPAPCARCTPTSWTGRPTSSGATRPGRPPPATRGRASSGPPSPTARPPGRWRPTAGWWRRRLELVLDGGLSATTGLSALAEEQRAFLSAVDISDGDRAAQLDAVAELAAEVLAVEREACAALGEAAGVGR